MERIIKYYVRTTGERVFDYSPLKYEKLIDNNHNSRKHFIESLNYIKETDSVLMEDDLILCNNFQEEIEKVINKHPNDVINFFTAPLNFFTSHYSMNFAYNQCTYFPKDIINKIYPIILRESEKSNSIFYGPLVNNALKELGIPHIVQRPALVQHKDTRSILCNCCGMSRNTIYFKDYIDKLGIRYIDSNKPENVKKLKELLKEDIDKWKKMEEK